MRKILLLSLALCLAGCAGSQEANVPEAKPVRPEIESFWNWFVANSDRLHDAGAEIYYEAYEEISKINQYLMLYLSNGFVDGKREVIISANAFREALGFVDEIIAAIPDVPELDKFIFTPFIQRQEKATITYPFYSGDYALYVEEVMVHYDENDEGTYYFIFLLPQEHRDLIFSDPTGMVHTRYMDILWIMAEYVLGEKTLATKIAGGEILPLNLNVVMPMVPFIQLQDIIGDAEKDG